MADDGLWLTGMTTRDVMYALAVKDPDTVYAMFRAGKIRGNWIGRQYRFSRASVDAFSRGVASSIRRYGGATQSER